MGFWGNIVAVIGFFGFLRLGWYLHKFLLCAFGKPKDLKKMFKNDWVLITGASSGVGRALTKMVYAQQMKIAVVGRNEDRLKSLKDECPEIHIIKQDLSAEDAVDKIFAGLPEGAVVRAMFICHGHGAIKFIDQWTDQEILDYNASMLTTNVLLFKKFQSQCTDSGTITIISSANAFTYGPLISLYGPAKRFMTAFAQHMMIDFADSDISVQVLNPGLIGDTNFFSNCPRAYYEYVQTQKKNALTAEKVAKSILASVGANISADVGYDALAMRFASWLLPGPLMDLIVKIIMKPYTKRE